MSNPIKIVKVPDRMELSTKFFSRESITFKLEGGQKFSGVMNKMEHENGSGHSLILNGYCTNREGKFKVGLNTKFNTGRVNFYK
jgi:hypothetical protein